MAGEPIRTDLPIEGLEWDDDNQEHIERHGLTADFVYEVLEWGDPVMITNKKGRSGSRQVIGYDERRRCWTIVVEPTERRRIWRVRTGWLSAEREIALYWKLRRQRG